MSFTPCLHATLPCASPLSLRVAVKPLGILVCAIMAWGQSKKVGGYYGPGYGRTIAMGLVLSSIGDINLELSESYPLAFKVGLVAFLLGACGLLAGCVREDVLNGQHGVRDIRRW